MMVPHLLFTHPALVLNRSCSLTSNNRGTLSALIPHLLFPFQSFSHPVNLSIIPHLLSKDRARSSGSGSKDTGKGKAYSDWAALNSPTSDEDDATGKGTGSASSAAPAASSTDARGSGKGKGNDARGSGKDKGKDVRGSGKGKYTRGDGKGKGSDARGDGKGKGARRDGKGKYKGKGNTRSQDRVRGGFLNKKINIVESVGGGATPLVLRSIARTHLNEEGSGGPYFVTIQMCELIMAACEEGSIDAQRRAWEDLVELCRAHFVQKDYNEFNPRTADQIFGAEAPAAEEAEEDPAAAADLEEAPAAEAAEEAPAAAAGIDLELADEAIAAAVALANEAVALASEAGEDTPDEQVVYHGAGHGGETLEPVDEAEPEDDMLSVSVDEAEEPEMEEVPEDDDLLPDELDDWENR